MVEPFILRLSDDVFIYLLKFFSIPMILSLDSSLTSHSNRSRWKIVIKNVISDNYRLSHLLFGHTNEITCIISMSNGNIASGSSDKTIRIWDLGSGSCTKQLCGHRYSILCLIQLRDGRLLSGSLDTTIRMWNPDKNIKEKCKIFRGHRHNVLCLAELTQPRFASGSDDWSIIIWNTVTEADERIISGHTSSVLSLLSFDERHFISGGYDNLIKVWSMHTFQCEYTLSEDRHCAEKLFHDSRGKVISVGADKTIRFRTIFSDETSQVNHFPYYFKYAYPLKEGRFALVKTEQDCSTIEIWNTSPHQKERQFLSNPFKKINCPTQAITGELISGNSDGSLTVWVPFCHHLHHHHHHAPT